MPQVFVDTVAWLALLNRRDTLHTRAQATRRELYKEQTRFITTEFVLMEVADALSAPALRTHVVRFINALRLEASVPIFPASTALFAAGWALYSQRPDKEWSLTDCTSFVVMEREQMTEAFTPDHHFEQAGFRILL